MKRFALPIALLATLAMPAGALAAGSGRGVVLSLDAAHHTLQLIAADHSVHAYRYRGRLHAQTGSTLRFSRHGNRISAIRVTGRSRHVSYLAKVVRSSRKHLVLRVADGRTVSLAGRRIRNAQIGHVRAHQVLAHAAAIAWTGSAPATTIQIQGLASGTTVLVTESLAGESPGTITLTIPPRAPASGGGSGAGGGATSDQAGSITQLSAGSVTIQTPSAGPMTFSVASGSQLTQGFAPGDVVDVTYRSGSSSTRVATDIGYVESDATGTVTSASGASLVIADAGTGQTDSFTAARSELMFGGVLVGDQVDVSYHLNGTRMVADGVDDVTADNANR